MSAGTYTDFRIDDGMIDKIGGKHWFYSEAAPDKKYEIVSLLDGSSEEVDDIECAAGGVVKIAENSFMVFML